MLAAPTVPNPWIIHLKKDSLPAHSRRTYRTDRSAWRRVLNDTGASADPIPVNSPEGAPKDKFTVKDASPKIPFTGTISIFPFEEKNCFQLKEKCSLTPIKEIWVRDCFACAEEAYRLKLPGDQRKSTEQSFSLQHVHPPGRTATGNFTPLAYHPGAGLKGRSAVDGTEQRISP